MATVEEWEKSVCPFEDLVQLRGMTLGQVVDSITTVAMADGHSEECARQKMRHLALCLLILTGEAEIVVSLLQRSAERVLALCVNSQKYAIDDILADIQNLN